MVKPIIRKRIPCIKGKNRPTTPSTINVQPTTSTNAFLTARFISLKDMMRGQPIKVTEGYVSTIFASSTMVLSPKDQDEEQDHASHHQIKAPHHVLHGIPVLPEEVTDHGNHRHPGRRPQEIE